VDESVLSFWFEEIDPGMWWKKDTAFDQTIATRFGDLHRAAAQGELDAWRRFARGRLAEIILLDQFSRNIHRDRPEAFAQDAAALVLAQEAIANGCAEDLNLPERSFLYMPFMHSESLKVHDRALQLFSEPGLEDSLAFEKRHRAIIERFGRYPHRNAILGRTSTAEELAFLQTPGSSF
jgi:uncharacterized protein (DUF924 family)